MKFNKKGFTLIEILIVVAIIGILASIVLVGLGPAQKQGRDARRLSDLRQVQNGLELYFQKCGFYPGGPNATQPCTDTTPADSWGAMTAALEGSLIGISQGSIPNDPQENSGKFYWYGGDGSSYVLGAQLEGPNTALDSDVDGLVNGVECGDPAADTIYCVRL